MTPRARRPMLFPLALLLVLGVPRLVPAVAEVPAARDSAVAGQHRSGAALPRAEPATTVPAETHSEQATVPARAPALPATVAPGHGHGAAPPHAPTPKALPRR